jgi:hypothetical protein
VLFKIYLINVVESTEDFIRFINRLLAPLNLDQVILYTQPQITLELKGTDEYKLIQCGRHLCLPPIDKEEQKNNKEILANRLFSPHCTREMSMNYGIGNSLL